MIRSTRISRCFLCRWIAFDPTVVPDFEHLLAPAAPLHAIKRRSRPFPDIALVFQGDVGVLVGPAQRFRGSANGKNLGGVIAAPAMMGRSGCPPRRQ
jgi:hypothetical protein